MSRSDCQSDHGRHSGLLGLIPVSVGLLVVRGGPCWAAAGCLCCSRTVVDSSDNQRQPPNLLTNCSSVSLRRPLTRRTSAVNPLLGVRLVIVRQKCSAASKAASPEWHCSSYRVCRMCACATDKMDIRPQTRLAPGVQVFPRAVCGQNHYRNSFAAISIASASSRRLRTAFSIASRP